MSREKTIPEDCVAKGLTWYAVILLDQWNLSFLSGNFSSFEIIIFYLLLLFFCHLFHLIVSCLVFQMGIVVMVKCLGLWQSVSVKNLSMIARSWMAFDWWVTEQWIGWVFWGIFYLFHWTVWVSKHVCLVFLSTLV